MYKYLQSLERQLHDDLLIKGKFIYSVINDFKIRAIEIAKQIINEQLIGVDEQSFYPLDESQYDEYFTSHPHIENSFFKVFYNENIAFKLAFSNMKESSITDLQSQNVEKVSIYYEEAIKQLTNEFRALNELNNIVISEVCQDPYFSIRVPLSCLIEYKGIVCLALSIPCIDPDGNQSSTLLKGYNNQDEFINRIDHVNNLKLQTDLRRIGQRLNLKSHLLNNGDEIELCSTLQIHKLLNNDYEDLQLCENIDNIEDFAPQFLNFCFLIKCANLFPLDVNIESDMAHPHYKIRPEFLKQYNIPLNGDGFVTEQNEEIDELDISNATAYLRTTFINKFVKDLESLEFLPIDSQSLTQCFHQNGINIRYLGEVYKSTTISHIKKMCQIEIVARICKKFLRNNIYDSIKEHNILGIDSKSSQSRPKSIFQVDQSGRFSQKATNQKIIEYQRDLKNQFKQNNENHINENLLDFLNLLLGSGEETEFFWSSIINKQAIHDYGCQVNRQDINKGGLIHAIKYHCKIEFTFNQDTGIFEQANPFSKDQIIGFVCRYKLYDMKELQINKQGSLYSEQMKAGQNEQALQNINLKLSIISWLKMNSESNQFKSSIQQIQSATYNNSSDLQTHQEDFNLLQEEIKLLSDQSELLLNFQNYEESTIKAVQALDISPVAHVCQIKSLGNILRTKLAKSDNQKAMECLDRAVQIIEFHLGQFHPLQTILYSQLGQFYCQKKYHEEAIALYRISLINCKKSLGEQHPQTAEVYKGIGNLYLKMGMYDESLFNFETSYKIYVACKKVDSLPFAEVCQQLATLCLAQSKFDECQTYCLKSIRIYEMQQFQDLKKIIDSHLILCRAQEIVRDHEKCLENADMIWNIAKELDSSEQPTIYEAIIKIILQVFISNMQIEKVNLLFTLTQYIDKIIQEEKSGINLVGFELQKYNQGLNYILDQINLGVYDSIESFLRSTLSIISKNMEYLYSVQFFDNFQENLLQLEDINLKREISKNLSSLKLFVCIAQKNNKIILLFQIFFSLLIYFINKIKSNRKL